MSERRARLEKGDVRADLPGDVGKAEIVAEEGQGCTRDGRTGVLAVACMQGN